MSLRGEVVFPIDYHDIGLNVGQIITLNMVLSDTDEKNMYREIAKIAGARQGAAKPASRRGHKNRNA